MDCVVVTGLHCSCMLTRAPEENGWAGEEKRSVIAWDVMSAEAAGTVVLFSLIHSVVLLKLPSAGYRGGGIACVWEAQ